MSELPKNKDELIDILLDAYCAGVDRSKYAPESVRSSFVYWYKNKDKDDE